MDRLNRTDFKLLGALASGKRNTAANIALEIDADRGYINNRFSYLLSNDLVERVGPKEKSGLYEITARGRAAARHQDKYLNDAVDDFETFISRQLSEGEPA